MKKIKFLLGTLLSLFITTTTYAQMNYGGDSYAGLRMGFDINSDGFDVQSATKLRDSFMFLPTEYAGQGQSWGKTNRASGKAVFFDNGVSSYIDGRNIVWKTPIGMLPVYKYIDASGPRMALGGSLTDPVILATGEYTFVSTDLTSHHEGTWFSVQRIYRHQTDNQHGVTDFGKHFHTNLRIEAIENSATEVEIDLGWGDNLTFTYSGGVWNSPQGFENFKLTKKTTSSPDYEYILEDNNGYTWTFEEETSSTSSPYHLESTTNIFGHGQTYNYTSGYLSSVTSGSNTITITRNGSNQITAISDSTGRKVEYDYDGDQLVTVEEGSTTSLHSVDFVWDVSGRIDEIKDNGNTIVREIFYDVSDRVDYYEDVNNESWNFTYGTSPITVTVDDRGGNDTVYTLDVKGQVTQMVVASGTADAATFSYSYDSNYTLDTITNPDMDDHKFSYDSRNRLTKIELDNGTTTKDIIEFAYTSDGQVDWVEDALNDRTDFTYTSKELTTVTHPDSTTTTLTYNVADPKGHPETVTTPESVKVEYTYNSDGFWTSKEINPDDVGSASTSRTVNAAGRVTQLTVPTWDAIDYTYNKLDLLTEIEKNGFEYEFGYDGNCRLTDVDVRETGVGLVEESTYTWNTLGQKTKFTDAYSIDTDYTYTKNGMLESTTDASGRVTKLVYDYRDRVKEVKIGDSTAQSVFQSLTYNDVNRVLTIDDEDSNTHTYAYNTLGTISKYTKPSSDYVEYTFNNKGQLTDTKGYDSVSTYIFHEKQTWSDRNKILSVRVYDEAGTTNNNKDMFTEYTYDDDNNIEKERRWVDSTNYLDTDFTYDGWGRLSKVTDPNLGETDYAYNNANQTTKITDPKNYETDFTYDNDQLTKITYETGGYTEVTLDHRNQPTTYIWKDSSNNKVRKVTRDYKDNGMLEEYRLWDDADGTTPSTDDYTIDVTINATTGLPTRLDFPESVYVTYSYSDEGFMTNRTNGVGDKIDLQSLDVGGLAGTMKVTLENNPDTDVVIDMLTSYNSHRKVTEKRYPGDDGIIENVDDIIYTFNYDDLDRISSIENGEAATKSYTRNDIGWITRIIDDSGGVAQYTDFDYNRLGQITKKSAYEDGTTGAQDTQYTYHELGGIETITYEDIGVVTIEYDDNGNMDRQVTTGGKDIRYTWNSLNKLSERKEYNATDNIDKWVYDDIGQMTETKRGSSTNDDSISKSVFAYNDLGQITSETQTIEEGTALVISYQYDKAGRIKKKTYHDTSTDIEYTYTAHNKVDKIKIDGTEFADYDWIGTEPKTRIVTTDYPGATNVQIKTTWTYNGMMWLESICHELITADQDDNEDLGCYNFTYDKAGNMTGHTADGSGLTDADFGLTYDDAGRLTQADITDSDDWTAVAEVTSTYGYNDMSSRTSHSYRDATSETWAYDKDNRLTTIDGLSQTYTKERLTETADIYDSDGIKYTYDYMGNLITIKLDDDTTVANLTYDAMGRLITYEDVVNGIEDHYYYDGKNVVGIYAPNGDRRHFYVNTLDLDSNIIQYSDNIGYKYILEGNTKNVRSMVDRAGSKVSAIHYDPFGQSHIREMPGRGDMDNDGDVDSTDVTRATAVKNGTYWDARADLDDDGDVDQTDIDIINRKDDIWNATAAPSVARAFEPSGNRFLFQGRMQMVIDTAIDSDDTATYDQFGYSISMDGDWMAVGAIAENGSTGAVYIYKFNGQEWRIHQKLTASDGTNGDLFGFSVDLESNRLAVGAIYWEGASGTNRGATYTFERSNNTWEETEIIEASDAADYDWFGFRVKLEGDILAVGCPYWEDAGSGANAGAVYVFSHDGTDWSEDHILEASDQEAGALFGFGLDMDGDLIAAGAMNHDATGGTDSGQAYVFSYNSGTSSWDEDAILEASDGSASDQFGFAVSIDTTRLAVSALKGDTASVNNCGTAYIFDEDSGWSETTEIEATDEAANDQFGYAIILDGDRVVVTAPWEDINGSDSGSAYVFEYSASTWSQDQKIDASDGAADDNFGHAVTMDGDELFITTVLDNTYTGKAYFFTKDTTWGEDEMVTAYVPSLPEDAKMELYNFRARTYDPKTGIFLIADPHYSASANTQTPHNNMYLFNNANPLRYIDPSGFSPIEINPTPPGEDTGQRPGDGGVVRPGRPVGSGLDGLIPEPEEEEDTVEDDWLVDSAPPEPIKPTPPTLCEPRACPDLWMDYYDRLRRWRAAHDRWKKEVEEQKQKFVEDLVAHEEDKKEKDTGNNEDPTKIAEWVRSYDIVVNVQQVFVWWMWDWEENRWKPYGVDPVIFAPTGPDAKPPLIIGPGYGPGDPFAPLPPVPLYP